MSNDYEEIKADNAKEMRKQFLSQASGIVGTVLAKARGEPVHTDIDNAAQISIFNAVVPMLQAAGDTQKIEAESTGSIIECLKQGTLTFTEAKELMQMLSVQSDIEDIKKLLMTVERLEANG